MIQQIIKPIIDFQRLLIYQLIKTTKALGIVVIPLDSRKTRTLSTINIALITDIYYAVDAVIPLTIEEDVLGYGY